MHRSLLSNRSAFCSNILFRRRWVVEMDDHHRLCSSRYFTVAATKLRPLLIIFPNSARCPPSPRTLGLLEPQYLTRINLTPSYIAVVLVIFKFLFSRCSLVDIRRVYHFRILHFHPTILAPSCRIIVQSSSREFISQNN